jgi:hypothetical protein
MVGLFNSLNFIVSRDESSFGLSKEDNVPCTKVDYGRQIYEDSDRIKEYIDSIYSSFGSPSYIIEDTFDGPVDCRVISSCRKHEIIYIEHWKNSCPERIYIFINVIDSITSSFVKHLYESVSGNQI